MSNSKILVLSERPSGVGVGWRPRPMSPARGSDAVVEIRRSPRSARDRRRMLGSDCGRDGTCESSGRERSLSRARSFGRERSIGRSESPHVEEGLTASARSVRVGSGLPAGRFLGLHESEVRATACAAAARASQSAIDASVRACERARNDLEAAQHELASLEEQMKRLRIQGSTLGRNWEAKLCMTEDKCKAAEELVAGLLARVERRQQREQLAREQGFRAKQESRAAQLELDELRGTGVATRHRSVTEDVGNVCVDGAGRYQIEFEGTDVTETLSLIGAGASLKKLRAGSLVEVVEVVSLPEEDRVRGRIVTPAGWISLLQMSSGFRWASELPQTSGCVSARAPQPSRVSARSPRRSARNNEGCQAQHSSNAGCRPYSGNRQSSAGCSTSDSQPLGFVSTSEGSLPFSLDTRLASMDREELLDLAFLAVGGGA